MSTVNSVGSRLEVLEVYGIHAFGGLLTSAGMCMLAKKIKDYFSPNAKTTFSKYLVSGVGCLAGIAATVCIASNPTAQKIALATLFGPEVAFSSRGQLFLDTSGPQFSSLSSIVCGFAGTALGCLAFHKLYA